MFGSAVGAEIEIDNGYVIANAKQGLVGSEFEFAKVSVGATHVMMMAATLAKGTTTISNAAREPEVSDLAKCLNAMGAKISGAGTSTITIEGVTSLSGARHRVYLKDSRWWYVHQDVDDKYPPLIA